MAELIVTITAGIALLIGGLFMMRYCLRRILGHTVRQVLTKLTVTPWHGLAVGTIAAAVMQSSTAVSLLTIGLVSADYMSFQRGLGIILGANIGTCSTVQLIAAAPPENSLLLLYVLLFMLFGALVIVPLRYYMLSIAGITSMFLGIALISSMFERLSDMETFVRYISYAQDNYLYGIIAGILLTGLLHSSSASTSILMLLAAEGIIDLTTAIYVIYGNNIGSCLSSVLVSATVPVAARRVAISHILLNLLGTIIFFPLTGLLAIAATWIYSDFAGQVATAHTLFNIISSVVICPFTRQYSNFIVWLVPDRNKKVYD